MTCHMHDVFFVGSGDCVPQSKHAIGEVVHPFPGPVGTSYKQTGRRKFESCAAAGRRRAEPSSPPVVQPAANESRGCRLAPSIALLRGRALRVSKCGNGHRLRGGVREQAEGIVFA